MAGRARQGVAGLDMADGARLGMARQGIAGRAELGRAGQVKTWQEGHGEARYGETEQGLT